MNILYVFSIDAQGYGDLIAVQEFSMHFYVNVFIKTRQSCQRTSCHIFVLAPLTFLLCPSPNPQAEIKINVLKWLGTDFWEKLSAT